MEKQMPEDEKKQDNKNHPPHDHNTSQEQAAEEALASEEAVSQTEDTPEEKLAVLEKQLAEAQDSHVRALAELDNLRKRHIRERQDALTYGGQKLLEQLLPVIDNFERALPMASSLEGPAKALQAGLQMIQKELTNFLDKQGVKEVEAYGKPFDPHHHEAIPGDLSVEETKATRPEHVGRVVQKGYALSGRLLRPAMVVVRKAEESDVFCEEVEEPSATAEEAQPKTAKGSADKV